MSDTSPAERARLEHQKVIRGFGILESDLKALRALPPDEAEWRIIHEHNVCADFLEQRTDFIMAECVNNRISPPIVVRDRRSIDGDTIRAIPRDVAKRSGSKVG